jgi:hypothetical protein
MTRTTDAARRQFAQAGAVSSSPAAALAAALTAKTEAASQDLRRAEVLRELADLFVASREAAEEEAQPEAPPRTSAMLIEALRNQANDSPAGGAAVPLNGAGVLGIAAAAMGPGATINSGQ